LEWAKGNFAFPLEITQDNGGTIRCFIKGKRGREDVGKINEIST
jgi:hypothetical protein